MVTKVFAGLGTVYGRVYINKDGELLRENPDLNLGYKPSRTERGIQALAELGLVISAYKELKTQVDVKGMSVKSNTANFPPSPEYKLFVIESGATVERWTAGNSFSVYRFSKETLENLVEKYKYTRL